MSTQTHITPSTPNPSTYIISNQRETLFLTSKKGKLTTTPTRSEASAWKESSKAQKVLVTLPRTILNASSGWKVTENIKRIPPTTPQTSIKPPTQSKSTKIFTYNANTEPDFKASDFCINIRKRKEYLISELEKREKERNDVYHYIEFTSLNACQGYKVYKLLKNILTERRQIKNELQQIEIMLNNTDTETILTESNKVLNKHYSPRILNDLFKVGV